jgi:hypothetical protein
MTLYRREDLESLLGPVLTQYGPPPTCDCADLDIAGTKIPNVEQPVPFSVNTAGCTEFDRLTIAFAGPLSFSIDLDRSEGTLSGTTWSTTLQNIFLAGNPGEEYTVTVTLFDDNGLPTGDPCVETISLAGIQQP